MLFDGRQTGPASMVAIALGSNRSHGRYGQPRDVLCAAVRTLEELGLPVFRLSPIVRTPPLGHCGRDFANAALLTEWRGSAYTLLALLKEVERMFGRRRGRRWGPRVLDLDILLIGGTRIRHHGLSIPHRSMAERDFVLGPLAAILPDWRHPETGLTVRQMLRRLQRPVPATRPVTSAAERQLKLPRKRPAQVLPRAPYPPKATDLIRSGATPAKGARSSVGRATDF